MPPLTVAQASARYGGFYVPRFEIVAGGARLDPAVLRDVVQVTYNDSTTEIDSFDLTVNNWDATTRSFKYVGSEESVEGATAAEQIFNPGAREFELRVGYGSELTTLARGSTASLEPTFPQAAAPTLTVRALNVLHRLRTKRYRDHWPNHRVRTASASRIAQDIGGLNDGGCRRFPIPIRVDQGALRREPHLDYVAQDNQFDIDFLLIEARKIGYVVYIDQEPLGRGTTREVLRFGPSDARHAGVPDVTYELQWGVSLLDFTPKLSTANQVTSVEVRSWNRQTNRAIRERVDLEDPEIRANRDLIPLLPARGCNQRNDVLVDEPQHTPEQARRRALAILSDRIKELVEATGTTVGLPNLRAGQRVRIRGLGARFSGTYFVIKTTHTINDSGYITRFTARREEAGSGGAS